MVTFKDAENFSKHEFFQLLFEGKICFGTFQGEPEKRLKMIT
jgi:hypothetical protein